MLNSKEAYEKSKKSVPKDVRYVLKYIDKRIKYACKQGKFYIMLNNQITRERLFGKPQYYNICELLKVIEILYIKGYSVDNFEYGIKISWEKQKKGI